ncbi:MAG: RNA polymerase sigma factor region1.1 domain-containing protein, partial [Gammaproteobacteria bacterium]
MTEKQVPINDDKQSQLKLLIARGKEQGYLTYGEVNDHLPNDIVDPEQIEDIVNMINDMGITVYEKAPDAEELLLSDSAVQNDDDDTEEAAAALATVDSEFGRTTDPVRMYMREMGTVELLTREGEIRIAKRIEEGLEQVRHALSRFPTTIDILIENYEAAAAGEGRMLDLVTGFIDPDDDGSVVPPGSRKDEDEAKSTDGPDLKELAARMKKLTRLHKQAISAIEKHGSRDSKTEKIREKVTAEFMQLKLAPKLFEDLVRNLRSTVQNIRTQERQVMHLCVRSAGMPRKDFIG